MSNGGTARWMTTVELMKEAGIGRTAFYNALRDGALPIQAYKFGGRYLFSRREWERLQGIEAATPEDQADGQRAELHDARYGGSA